MSKMATKGAVILLCLISSTFAARQSLSFKKVTVTDYVVQEEKPDAKSPIICANECLNKDLCQGMIYDDTKCKCVLVTDVVIGSEGCKEVFLHSIPSSTELNLNCKSSCAIKCSITIDDFVDNVSYNGIDLEIEGNKRAWADEKTFEFSSCDNAYPGILVIKGSDKSNSNSYCTGSSVMILHCTASNTTSPWHNFVSDGTNWKSQDGKEVCVPTNVYIVNDLTNKYDWFRKMVDAGAKAIWADAKEVTLIGTPPAGLAAGGTSEL